MTSQVKICGLTRTVDIEQSIESGAEFLGFIIEAPSKRRLSLSQARHLFNSSIGRAKRVAVTVNADDALLDEIQNSLKPDYVQFHGDETVEQIANIGRRYNFKTIKACAIATDKDMLSANEYAGVADLILYDAKPPKGSNIRGGHGLSIDWNIIKRAPTPKVFALAGGLTPETVKDALNVTHAPILDVSSGVEASAGVKDSAKIKAFMKAVKDNG
ncbi:phosphoribosylanthranilate isomerase [Litorimonas taeanensis]|uniref:N-(5'-phosphoribosyl)anthranilate isomerase n=1 Tax=Litorimonas taeanensis TaxID=568099 RepID=A0A420WIJ7_9PROT|nr:phosphoribosylanthranilate isomerase [Litorimonas taeanensis]RKQ70813.1 phosphoribosylanthranilate isomerase [Litorimonas taeanensis]